MYSMELLDDQIRWHQVPWNSTELGDCYTSPWIYEVAISNITVFHEIPWNKGGVISNDRGFHRIHGIFQSIR